jgi:hypothetical protein
VKRFILVFIFLIANSFIKGETLVGDKGTVTATIDGSGLCSWSYSFANKDNISGHNYSSGWLYREATSNGVYPSVTVLNSYWDTGSNSPGSTARSASGSFQTVAGAFYRLYERDITEVTNNVVILRSVLLSFPGQSQTITASVTTAVPASGSFPISAGITLTASGGQTSYLWAIKAGSSGSLSATTGASVVYTPSAVGTQWVTVKAISSATYAVSNSVDLSMPIVVPYATTISIPANNTDWDVTWHVSQVIPTSHLWQSIEDFDQLAHGAAIIKQYTNLPYGASEVDLTVSVHGVNSDFSHVWQYSPSGQYLEDNATVIPVNDGIGSQVVAKVPLLPSGANPNKAVSGATTLPAAAAVSSGSVWSSAANAGSGTNYTGPTEGTFREGVAKLETRLIDANASLETIKSAASAGEARVAAAGHFSASSSLSSGQSAASSAAAYSGQTVAGSAPAVTHGGSDVGRIGPAFTVGNQSLSVNMIPVGVMAPADSILRAGRPVLLWAAVLSCIWVCGGVLNIYVASLPSVGGATGSVGPENVWVPGVAQGKAWGSAALLVGGSVALVAVIIGMVHTYAYSYGFGINSLFTAVGFSTLGDGFAILERYIPVAALCNLYVFNVAFSFLVAPVYVAATSAMRFFTA